jgi:tRNA threonylcarbamoyladenosine biosynthesis protein TsaB
VNERSARDVLLLHTCDTEGVVAAACGERFEVEVLDAQQQQARSLLVGVEAVLERSGIELEHLQGIVVTTGPGSFTGIRIGLATCQGLAAACGWPVWACDSLVPEAATQGGIEARVAVVQDARRGEVYAALYDVRGDVPDVALEPICAAPGVAAAQLAAAAVNEAVVALGSGVHLVRDELGSRLSLQVVERAPRIALARSLYQLARSGACQRRAAETLAPEYLRRPDVQVQRRTVSGA